MDFQRYVVRSDLLSEKFLYGLDLSLSCTGIAIVSLRTKEPVLITSIKTKQNKQLNEYNDHKERLKIITDTYDELINTYPVHAVAIEYPFVKFNKSTKAVMKVHGVTQRWFYNYPQYFYAPTTIKATITGNGQAKKEIVEQVLKRMFPNTKFKNSDESDALGVAVTCMIKNKLI